MGDEEDEKPEDWDQPEMIPDPKSTKPDDWDEEDDGAFEPPDIPNPGFKGNWRQATLPDAKYLKPAQELLKSVAEKHGKKVMTLVVATSDNEGYVGHADYGFSKAGYAGQKAVTIEE